MLYRGAEGLDIILAIENVPTATAAVFVIPPPIYQAPVVAAVMVQPTIDNTPYQVNAEPVQSPFNHQPIEPPPPVELRTAQVNMQLYNCAILLLPCTMFFFTVCD